MTTVRPSTMKNKVLVNSSMKSLNQNEDEQIVKDNSSNYANQRSKFSQRLINSRNVVKKKQVIKTVVIKQNENISNALSDVADYII